MDTLGVLKVGLVQSVLKHNDKKYNVNKVISMMTDYLDKDESMDILFIPNDFFRVGSESIPGETTNLLAEICKKYNIFIAGGMAEKVKGVEKALNTGFLIFPDGTMEKMQTKHHLPKEESERFTNISMSRVIDTGFFKIGCVMCNDIFYPELARIDALNDADFIFVPSIIVGSMIKPLQIILQARALENQVYVINVNGIPYGIKENKIGESGIYSPFWYELDEQKMDNGEQISSFIIDIDNIREIKASKSKNMEDYAMGNILYSLKPEFKKMYGSKYE